MLSYFASLGSDFSNIDRLLTAHRGWTFHLQLFAMCISRRIITFILYYSLYHLDINRNNLAMKRCSILL